jgi:hypothetical protein
MGHHLLDQHHAHVAAAIEPLLDERVRAAVAGVVADVTTHNGTPVTSKNLRWAATHEALCRSFIFDVLTGLADALDAATSPQAAHHGPRDHEGLPGSTGDVAGAQGGDSA